MKPLNEIEGLRGVNLKPHGVFSLILSLTKFDSQSEDVIRFFDEKDNEITFYMDSGEIYDIRIEINESKRNLALIKDINMFLASGNFRTVDSDGVIVEFIDK
jgi:hypothetical protein